MRNFSRRSLAGGLLICVISACDKPAAISPPTPPTVAKPKAAPVILTGKAREQLETQARAWADLINEQKAEEVMKDFALSRLFKSVTDEIDCEESTRRGLLAGMAKGGKEISTTIAKQWNGGVARFQKVLETSHGTVVRMRIVSDDGTSYLDLIPEVTKDGKVTILDMDNRSMGVCMSDSMRQAVVAMINARPQDSGLLGKLFGESDVNTENYKNLQEYAKSTTSNKARAFEIYPKLPLGIRKNRAFFASYLQAAISLNDDKAYMTAMVEGEKYFPNDPSIQFMLGDYHLLRKEYEEVEKCMTNTMKELGEDGNLWMLQASMRMTAGQPDAADEAYHNSIRLEPDVLNHHFVGFQIAAKRKDYPELVNRLKAAGKGVGKPISLMETENEDFNAARASAEYKAYAANLKVK